MKYQIITFGCQFNIADQERLTAVLEQAGFVTAVKNEPADLIVVFACSVRQSAIDRLHGLKHRFDQIRKTKPLVTVLTGCVLKSDQSKMGEIFDYILETKDLPQLVEKISHLPIGRAGIFFKVQPKYQSKFEAFVPIMTGCNNFCTYCVVPYTRGREISRPLSEVIKECQDLVQQGYKLITLIGQNVNSYRAGNRSQGTEIRFPELLKMVDKITGDYWLSFATSHPKDMSDELIKVMASSKHLIPYLHLPVQAGDDEILRKMNRRYTARHYQELIKKVRRAIPAVTLSTDVIVGFPTETKVQFQKTLKLFKAVKFDMAYLARYSPRVGTVAAKMTDNVSLAEKKRREEVLNSVLKKTALNQNKKMLGQHLEVLVENYKDGFCFGKTKNFKDIKFKSHIDLTGKIVLVKVTGCYAWGLSGALPQVIVLLGPTSSGKTKLAVSLAKKFKGEIISADSRQVYQGMDIGTGKDLADYGKIKYHLIDIKKPTEQLTVADWQKLAYEKINEIIKRDKLPIVCGGTGLYLSALVEGYSFLPNEAGQLAKIRRRLNQLTLKKLLTVLKKVDLATYNVVDKNNRRRVQRALEIYYQTGRPKSEQLEKQKPPYDFLLLGLNFPKLVLDQRIKQRLLHRLTKEGLVKEIKRLHNHGVSWRRLEEFGLEYRFISRFLQKKISYDEMVLQLFRAISDFAKRQRTWFSRQNEIIWLENKNQAIRLVNKFIK